MDARRSLLWGRSSAVSRQLALLAVGLLGLLTAIFFTDVNTLWPAPLVPTGVVLLVGLTALAAFFNEGLVVAWVLAFAGGLPAFVFYPPRGPRYAVNLETAPATVAEATAVAVGLGTVGFAVGAALRRRRDRRRGERYVPSDAVLPTVLVGRDHRRVARWLLVATTEFVAVFAVSWGGLVPFGVGLAGLVGIVLLLGLMTVPVGYLAAVNRGLLVGWALASAPLFGVFLAIQLRFVGPVAPDRPVLYAFGTAAFYAIPVGTGAFVLGEAARHLGRGFGPAARESASHE